MASDGVTARAALAERIASCRLCADRFSATATHHEPRPVVWFRSSASVLIAGQAPGLRVHRTGRPFDDPSGRRLRDWLGLSETEFWDRDRIAIVPIAFCFPGYDARGADLPPPPVCARTWRPEVMAALPGLRLTILVGAAAMRWHLNARGPVAVTVAGWRDHAPQLYPLPHPSWRNTGWMKRHPWVGTDLLPKVRARLREVLDAG